MLKLVGGLFARLWCRIVWVWPMWPMRAPGPLSLQRFAGPADPPRMRWKACHPRTAHRFKAQLTCSRGHGITLSAHSIEPDGRVRPSVVCRSPGCDFHEVVRLDGWTGGHLT